MFVTFASRSRKSGGDISKKGLPSPSEICSGVIGYPSILRMCSDEDGGGDGASSAKLAEIRGVREM